MRKLPLDRKRYLLRQNRQMRSTVSASTGASRPSHAASLGPTRASQLLPALVPQLTGDNGLMKRFSIATWGANSPVSSEQAPTPSSPKPSLLRETTRERPDDVKLLQPQSTGSLWNSWWSSSGGEASSPTKSRHSTKESTSAASYVQGLRSRKSTDVKLVKHLISLRVHLSTAKLSWVEQFLDEQKGMAALGTLLAELVGKGGKRKKLTDVEETVLYEVIKCLRVLLNTEVSDSMNWV